MKHWWAGEVSEHSVRIESNEGRAVLCEGTWGNLHLPVGRRQGTLSLVNPHRKS